MIQRQGTSNVEKMSIINCNSSESVRMMWECWSER